jgi:hypothetical protein
MLACPKASGFPPIYAVFDDLALSLCPLCTSAYQPGCSTVAVKSLEQTRMADLIPGDNRALQRSCLRPSAILTFHSIGRPEEAAPYRRLSKSEDPLQL